MGNEWPVVRLGNHCLKIGSGATPKGGSSVYSDSGSIWLIRSQNIYNDGFNPSGLVFISEDAADKLKNVIVQENDILLNITGDSVARVCLAKKEYLPARVNQHVAIIRPDPKHFDARYLRYVLASPVVQQILLNLASAGATRNALTKGMIEEFEVSKPPLSIQIAVADHLESFDEKITLNRQINQTLEQMAQTLFKSWFVDFDPVIDNALDAGNEIPESLQNRAELRQKVRASQDFQPLPADVRVLFPAEFEESALGWVPKGWECSPLSRLFGIKHGFAFKGEYFCDEITSNILLTPGNVKIGGGFKSDKFKYYLGPTPNEYVFNTDDLYVNMTDLSKISDTLGYPARVPENSEIQFLHNQRLGRVVFTHHPAAQKEFVYQVLCSDHYRNTVLGSATGTTVKHTSPSKILDHVICHSASGNPEKAFENMISFMSKKISINNQSSEHLTKLRDTLLPKLISGELRLDEIPSP